MQALTAPAPLAIPRPRWSPPRDIDEAAVVRLRAELKLPVQICRLLVARGHADPSVAREFLRPHEGQVHPAELLAGMAEAVERLRTAIRRGETILVHGDYDVDGICATSLLVRALRSMGANAVPFVPHRIRDGYDLGAAGIAAARAAGATLIVTADCGIVAHAAVADAARAGIDVIVTDHHTPGADLPAAVAVVNPNRADCPYPGKGLSGAAVAYKLACAVAPAIGYPPERFASLLDFVAVATIADLAPLTGENRALVRWGMAVLARTPNPGFRALLRATRLAERDEITAGQIGYILAPRLNAIGRLDDAMTGVRLLLTEDPREAAALANQLEAVNRRRRDLDEATLGEALSMLEREWDPERDWGVVLASPSWHPGVIGIVASRIVERIHRPTVLIALGAEEGKGSARSIPGFHLHEAFVRCADHLIRYGGHRAAAGCSIRPDRVEAFRDAFTRVAEDSLRPLDPAPVVAVDADLSLADADHSLCRLLRHFGPFGVGNPGPVFRVRGVGLHGRPRVVGKQHLKMTLADEGAMLEAIGFGMADRSGEFTGANPELDAVFKLEENRWVNPRTGRESRRVQARLVDFRVAG